MSTDVIMPQMGESIFEGTITKWLKKPGDAVEKDEPLFEISTDKVDAEIPSPVAGVLAEIKIAEGATVEVNTVVAVIAGGAAIPQRPANALEKHAQKSAATQVVAPQVSRPAAQQEQTAPLPIATPAPYQPVRGGVAIVMPQLGESIFEGTITKWLKKAGDAVEKDEPLLEISTDKVDAEIPAPFSGIVTEIRAPEGATVEVNTVVAVMRAAGAEPAAALLQESASPQMTPKARVAAGQVPASQVAPVEGRIRSSPLARRIAKEHGIDLSSLAGTGAGGRIGKEDVLRTISAGSPAHRVQRAAEPQVGQVADLASLPAEPVPLTRMRALIAERMVESVRISPHVHTIYKIDMTRIARLRERHMTAFNQRHGVKLTYMPFIAAAVVVALRHFPIVNASLEKLGDAASGALAIRYHRSIHLGIAVALDWGLIVPVIRQAEQRSFADLARTIADLALRARTKQLSPDEVGGSTFTLTNAGAFGGEYGLPIINQPESAILAVGGLRKEPAVVTDAEGKDSIAIRIMQQFCLGFDHRLIDGADAGKFMLQFKKALETWDQEIG